MRVLELAGEGGPLPLRRALAASSMLSSDVSAGFDPAYASAFEAKNSAFLGRGLVFNKYTGSRGKSGSNDANAEYVARIRRVMDDAGVSFQTAELGKVDVGGGGTIGVGDGTTLEVGGGRALGLGRRRPRRSPTASPRAVRRSPTLPCARSGRRCR